MEPGSVVLSNQDTSDDTAPFMVAEVRFFWTVGPGDGKEERKPLPPNHMQADGRQGTDPLLCPQALTQAPGSSLQPLGTEENGIMRSL